MFQDKHRKSAIHYCCSNSDDKCLKILIEKGADVNIQDEMGRTALWTAVSKDDRGHIVNALLNGGCLVNLRDDREKRNPLQVNIFGLI